MAWLRLGALGFLLIATVALGGGAQAQDGGLVPEQQSCEAAAIWHLTQALRWTDREDQSYHMGAADAAERLATRGDASCDGWMDDSEGVHAMPDGSLMAGNRAVDS